MLGLVTIFGRHFCCALCRGLRDSASLGFEGVWQPAVAQNIAWEHIMLLHIR